jgi:hypothetical protein
VKYLPPTPWAVIRTGEVVLIDGTPRTVLATDGTPTSRMIFAEGIPPIVVDPRTFATVVELDAADAIGNLYVAGLDPHRSKGRHDLHAALDP